jgi:hypothetical protein
MKLAGPSVGFVLGAAAVVLMGQAGAKKEGQAPAAPKSGSGAPAATKPAPAAPVPAPQEMPDMAAAMKAWKDAMSPGPEHRKLAQFIGKWDTKTRVWWGGPGTPPMETPGTSDVQWALENRFLIERTEYTFMIPDETGAMNPVPTRGIGLTGYDNYRKMYVACWADSMGTQLLTMRGGSDPSGHVFTAYGEMDEPMLGVIGRTVKYVSRIVDQDRRFFEIYDLHAGEDYKVVEIEYTRRR